MLYFVAKFDSLEITNSSFVELNFAVQHSKSTLLALSDDLLKVRDKGTTWRPLLKGSRQGDMSPLSTNRDREQGCIFYFLVIVRQSKILMFPSHGSHTPQIFDIVHSDIWGIAPMNKGIISQRSCPSTPQQNGVAERNDHHLLDMVRVLLIESFVLSLFGVKSCLLLTKLTPQSVKYVFLEYGGTQKGHVCYDPMTYCIRISHNVVFFEKQSFFTSDVVIFPPMFSILPNFLTGSSWYKPGLVYTRRHVTSVTTVELSSQTTVPPEPRNLPLATSDSSPDDVPPPVTLRHTFHDSRPPNRQAIEQEYLQQAMNAELEALQAWLVALGNRQENGIDYDEPFAPIVKITTARLLLSLAASRSCSPHQMDVKNAFLHGDLKEDIYIKLLFDDIIISGSDHTFIQKFQQHLYSIFHRKELGHLNYFLGLEVHTAPHDIFLNQHKYIQDLIMFAELSDASCVDTPLDLNVKYRKEEGDILLDPTLYRNLASLIYLTITSPDISFVVHIFRKFIDVPCRRHLVAVRCIIRYLIGTSHRGLFYPQGTPFELTAYSVGGVFFLGDAPISWKFKKQNCVSKSFTETEYHFMFAAYSEVVWLRGLLVELGVSQSQPTPLHGDNTSAIQIAANLLMPDLFRSQTLIGQQMGSALLSLISDSSTLDIIILKIKFLAPGCSSVLYVCSLKAFCDMVCHHHFW
ncbi:uncharacterized protein LOC111366952 [Olea europaea var. sylvestris]|uniref:uncharacterized protein LOC111366952 n=1 Tax=Olea europaea var. sylvestris TaxID=158386 RepID=UPI000C1D76AF|nr:uncharacterized protein LOC111366952 [Olea europaea var. sylvestris]